MNEKELLYGDEARTKILEGGRKVAKAVIATLGPLGRNVVIRRGPMRPPLITKDGVTVAKEIKSFEDFYEDQGLQMVKEAASKTNDIAGDGTTTATLLTFEMMEKGTEKIKNGKNNAIHIRKGMQKACEYVCGKLEEIKTVVNNPEQYKAIATISSQDEDIGALVALVIDEIGEDGAVTVEPAQTLGMDYILSEGMQLTSGYVSPYFAQPGSKLQTVINDPYILVCDERITDPHELIPVVDMVQEKKAPLVIIAESIEGDALNILVFNLPWVKIKGQDPSQKADFISLAIRAPGIGEQRNAILEDIAIKTGARVVSKKIGLTLKNINIHDLGRASRVISGATTSTIVDGAGDETKVLDRIETIKAGMATAEGEELDFLKGRLANISGKIAVIRVGAATEVEQKEKQHRVEDAIAAVRASAEEGIVPGGGTAYLRCMADYSGKVEGEKIGWDIVMETLKKPLWWIAENAGHPADEVVANVFAKETNQGFNAETGEYVDMMEANIIDPKKVSRCALQNAVSTAAAFLTVEVSIVGVPGSDPM